MKYLSITRSTTLLSLFAVVAILSSCQKEQGPVSYANRQTKVDTEDLRTAERIVANLPEIGIVSEDRSTVYKFNLNTREFSFSDPNPGWNFSNSDEVVFYPYNDGGGILFIGAGSIGSNTGGTVVAGETALDVNYTFCFSASDEALGLDLFDFGGDSFDGVSIVLGIAGDFEALAEGEVDEDATFEDFFQGFAMYIVYDNEASGSYEILNWLEDLDEDSDELAGHGFAYVIDFVNFSIYLSASGDLDVSGGQISFSGEYLGLLDLFLEFTDEEEGEPEFSVVSGFGTMGCN
ncbi:MAG: hypothetical protein GC193_04055 [Cryomorphaceae bacterium]|nr:hypothetical protein [Cryomorphaceae bacterium]